MNIYRKIRGLVAISGIALATVSCTDLTETVYDQIVTENYYNTKDDVIRAFVRPFDHAFWNITAMFDLQELTADQIGTFTREGWWYDSGRWERLHYHTWTIDHSKIKQGWTGNFQGVMQCSAVLDDFETLNPADFHMTQDEFDTFTGQLRTLRTWFYINLLDMYRNVPLAVSNANQSLNSVGQVTPQELFDFIESELLEVLPHLPAKEGYGGNQLGQGQWTQAAAASLLVRLYLNAEKWIGTAKYTECATYAQNILNGVYGPYKAGDRWDEPFDWNNETSDEVIYGFTASKSRARYHMAAWDLSDNQYFWALPRNIGNYTGFKEWGVANPKYALQPSRDIDGNLYSYTLGMPVASFQKYPEDYRLLKYRNLSGQSQREGMFLYGYLDYEENGETKYELSPNDYVYYIRDQVGMFKDAAPGTIIADKVSNMGNGDHNSGWHPVKYPIYRDGDPGAMEADFALIRLPEIIYSLAECKFRTGDPSGAAQLLNTVRRRNYPPTYHSRYLYQPEGAAVLTEDEFLAEWGREFLMEGRRRTDLIRWNKFTTGRWWDKEADGAGKEYLEIFPLHRDILGADPNLKQNPGYDTIQ